MLHEYNECYLYWSFMQEEVDPRIRAVWELHLNMEIEHLRVACELMRSREGRDPAEFLPRTIEDSQRMSFHENKAWLRKIVDKQVGLTGFDSEFVPVSLLPEEHRFFAYQGAVNDGMVPSEEVIRLHRERIGGEYRQETEGPHPIEGLRLGTTGLTPPYQVLAEGHAVAYTD